MVVRFRSRQDGKILVRMLWQLVTVLLIHRVDSRQMAGHMIPKMPEIAVSRVNFQAQLKLTISVFYLQQTMMLVFVRIHWVGDRWWRIRTNNDPTVEGNSSESQGNLTLTLVDGKVLTSYKAEKEQGELVYHLSEPTDKPYPTCFKYSSRSESSCAARYSERR